MAISAAQVKELRERTGSGMMECKKALVETDGDLDKAVELMRKKGLAKADKKADRVAAEGRVVAVVSEAGNEGVLLEVNCETDFVSSGENFTGFAERVAAIVLESKPADVAALLALPYGGGNDVQTAQKELVAKIGENVQVRRFTRFESASGKLYYYLHGTRIGVMVELQGGDEALGRDIAMHVAASNPVCVNEDGMPAETLEKEREILRAQAQDSGKPAEIIEKMIEGRVKKFLKETTLVGQPFVKDPDQTVGQLLKGANAQVLSFSRLEVGEGIEKAEGNFAEEVMAQVRGS
ncbi:elongation factor Ts [Natronocella acetinitrilica]|uniref:Elongation factor Ts n=1 Tax=Natronocella acetinitrilica TaxID=414046 RepID=A0AAE3KHA4_9GAMM|nr:translation elongation factor Ts [Natronocella acetinitrilica]MCP1676147.1 elongation factor Ts [Natronocella acetinitrilica]